MNVPFTVEDFLDLFVRYNVAVFPAQWVLISSALFAVVLLLTRARWANEIAYAVLVILWLWSGLIYHVAFFAAINPVAYLFGALFVLEAVLLALSGLQPSECFFAVRFDWRDVAGVFLVLSALLLYPTLNFVFGHRYPAMPTFGAPCPTTLFTIGLLFWVKPRPPAHLLVIPLLWSVVALSAAVSLGMYEDYLLLFALVGGVLAVITPRNRSLANVARGVFASIHR
jgi:hypothetical protein